MSTPEIVVATEELAEHKSLLARVWDLCRRQPLGAFGALMVLMTIFLAVFANVLTPYDPEAASWEHQLTAPNAQFLMGTDHFGRDILTRIIYGARTALFVGFTASSVGATLGLVLGVASAYFGGTFDIIVQRVVDVVLAFPLIILALVVVAAFGTAIEYVVIAIMIPYIPQ